MLCRKQLLNKCQEEFEKGAAAMEAVEAREKAEQAKSKEEKEQEQAEVPLPIHHASCHVVCTLKPCCDSKLHQHLKQMHIVLMPW